MLTMTEGEWTVDTCPAPVREQAQVCLEPEDFSNEERMLDDNPAWRIAVLTLVKRGILMLYPQSGDIDLSVMQDPADGEFVFRVGFYEYLRHGLRRVGVSVPNVSISDAVRRVLTGVMECYNLQP